MFYTFYQNNSHGRFVVNDGVSHYVIIQAGSHYEANAIAEGFIDFNAGCECCGDRWNLVYETDATNQPLIYGKPPSEFLQTQRLFPEKVIIYYKNGQKDVITEI